MLGDTPLISTIIAGLGLAFIFGFIAHRLRISPLVGYLLAGIIVGPYTGGFHADPHLTHQLSEIGVILLMFGVGLHFSLKDLLSVKFIAIPGAILQILTATLLGSALSWMAGGSLLCNVLFGLSLSTASTVVLLRNMQGLNLLETERGRIAVGWLIVEDLVMVLLLVMIPALVQGPQSAGHLMQTIFGHQTLALWQVISITLFKVLLFIALMLIIGRRVIPWMLQMTAQSGSRELFRLGILSIALGVAGAASYLFGVSFALGAFFAGLVMGETEFSQRAAEDSLPLRDAFAVLFFVSVGMLFNPYAIWEGFFSLIGALLIIILGKGVVAYFFVRATKKTVGTALTISASLAQIGEFSFILVGLGTSFGIFDEKLRNIIIGSAIFSILLNPLIFILADKLKFWLEKKELTKADDIEEIAKEEHLAPLDIKDHIIFIGYNALTNKIINILKQHEVGAVVLDNNPQIALPHAQENFYLLRGDANDPKLLEAANIRQAKKIVLVLENAFEAVNIVAQIKKLCTNMEILAYTHNDQEKTYLQNLDITTIIDQDEEIAKQVSFHLGYGSEICYNPPKSQSQPLLLTKVEAPLKRENE